MKIINDSNKLNYYIKKYNIDQIFEDNLLIYSNLHLFKKGEPICKTGDNLDYFYFLVEGKAKVYTILKNGKSLLLKIYEPFNNFGDIEVIEHSHITTNVDALTETLCVGIPLSIIRSNCLDNPIFLRYICKTLSEKLNSFSYRSSLNLLYPLENRLASYITSQIVSNEDYITLTTTFTNIADLLGTSYRHINRIFKKLSDEKIISLEGKRVYIHNKIVLNKLAQDIYK